eukprot:8041550-Pyramimonas_sp.AAC.1
MAWLGIGPFDRSTKEPDAYQESPLFDLSKNMALDLGTSVPIGGSPGHEIGHRIALRRPRLR